MIIDHYHHHNIHILHLLAWLLKSQMELMALTARKAFALSAAFLNWKLQFFGPIPFCAFHPLKCIIHRSKPEHCVKYQPDSKRWRNCKKKQLLYWSLTKISPPGAIYQRALRASPVDCRAFLNHLRWPGLEKSSFLVNKEAQSQFEHHLNS